MNKISILCFLIVLLAGNCDPDRQTEKECDEFSRLGLLVYNELKNNGENEKAERQLLSIILKNKVCKNIAIKKK